MIVDRIRGLARVPGSRLRAADENFRVHDARQRKVLKGLLAEVGIIGAVLAWVPDDMARAALRSSQDFAAWLAGYDGPLQLVDGHMRAEGGRASDRTVCRRLAEIAPQVRADRAASVAAVAKAAPPPKPPAPVEAHTVEPPPADAPRGNLSAAERQVDALLTRSPVWRRIQAAIAASLATYPDAAAAVARALREVTL